MQTVKDALYLKGTEGECNVYFRETPREDTFCWGNYWSDFTQYKHADSEEIPYFFSPLLSFGDYDNSCHIERSNVRVFMEEHEETQGKDWLHVTGSYGSEAIAIRINSTNAEIIETLQALENYPCLSDDDASNLEQEMISEALENFVLSDISRAIDKKLNIDYSNPDPELFTAWIYEVMEREAIYPKIEAGGNVYIPAKEIAEAAPEVMPQWYNAEYY